MKSLMGGLLALFLVSAGLAGCGGGWQHQQKANTTFTPTPTGAPTKALLQWGPEDAKVRLVGFFYISPDPRYQKHIAVFESLAKQYPKQLFVQYWDLRTPEGQEARTNSGTGKGAVGLLINGDSELTLPGHPPKRISFSQEMGRYWTEQDLRDAVALEIKQAYGK